MAALRREAPKWHSKASDEKRKGETTDHWTDSMSEQICCSPAYNPARITLRVVPCTGKQASEYVKRKHRHLPVVSDRVRFACAVAFDDPRDFVGVGIVGNGPPEWEGTGRASITRTATSGVHNACSMILGALASAAKALGYVEVWTYTLPCESGASLRAAGFEDMGWTDEDADWSSASKARRAPTVPGAKRRWRRRLSDAPPWARPSAQTSDEALLPLFVAVDQIKQTGRIP